LPPSDSLTSLRSPLARIIANGQLLPDLLEVEVSNYGHFSADNFSASLTLNSLSPYGGAFWSSEVAIAVQVLFSLDSITFVSLFTGTVDTVSINQAKRIVHIAGRDLSAQLIEARTEEAFSNQTSSDIALLFAARHGLTPNIATTTTPVGRYYQDEHDRLTLGQFSRSTTEWDLLVFLALQEGFDISVTGTALNFCPLDASAQTPYLITPANCIEMRLTRCLPIARDIEVTVKSWNSRLKSGFTRTVIGTSNTNPKSSISVKPQQYVFVQPNLTPEQALNYAQRKLVDLTMHERTAELVMPGDLSLTPNGQLIVSGTSTGFDQTYNIDVIERRLNLSDGFVQRVRAKSSSPRTTRAH